MITFLNKGAACKYERIKHVVGCIRPFTQKTRTTIVLVCYLFK